MCRNDAECQRPLTTHARLLSFSPSCGDLDASASPTAYPNSSPMHGTLLPQSETRHNQHRPSWLHAILPSNVRYHTGRPACPGSRSITSRHAYRAPSGKPPGGRPGGQQPAWGPAAGRRIRHTRVESRPICVRTNQCINACVLRKTWPTTPVQINTSRPKSCILKTSPRIAPAYASKRRHSAPPTTSHAGHR
jgi:hypothetical protein